MPQRKKARPRVRKWEHNAGAAAAFVVIEIAVLSALYLSPEMGVLPQWLLAIVSLVAAGYLIRRSSALQGWGFIFLAGSTKGLDLIDRVSRRARRFWNEMAVWGLVLGFGLLSYPLFRGMISKKQYAFGMVSLAVIMFLVLPYLTVALPFINIPQLQSALQGGSAAQGVNYVGVLFDAISFAGGFAAYVLFALLYNAGLIVYGVAAFTASVSAGMPQPGLLTQSIPGVAPIIPGIDIPLFAGVISLAILLIVHEASHGLLAREAKVRLKSLGLLILGIVPVGAYVEPDEKQVVKLDAERQTKIFSAGISANFVTMLVFVVPMVLFLYFLIPGITQNTGVFVGSTMPGYPAYNSVPVGSQVLSWGGYNISNVTDFENAGRYDLPNKTITIVTSNGTYSFRAKPVNATHGLVGIVVYEGSGIRPGAYASAVYFLYSVFALSFMLNFLVAVVNLLPLPGFDGWRIYQTNIRSAAALKALTAIVVVSLVINVLQWVFYI